MVRKSIYASILLCIGFTFFWLGKFSFSTHASTANFPINFTVENGESVRSIGKRLVALDILSNEQAFVLLVKMLGKSKIFMAGSYKMEENLSPYTIIQKMSKGDFSQSKILFPEGINFSEMLEIIHENPDLKHETLNLSDLEILQRLKINEKHPEGLFFPDTYIFSSGTSDLKILELAYRRQESILERLWRIRDKEVPFKTSYDVLILASIIEKEAARTDEMSRISEVFQNRLKKGIRLQADPTVIYGLSGSFDGNLRKDDLRNDTPYNTYTRYGLPPTPIAMPGKLAMNSVFKPSKTGAIYFVSKGDGTHYFSKTLREHNNAVNKYQRKKKNAR